MLHHQLLANVSVETSPQAAADPISFQTALLVIIAGALIVLAKNFANLNRRLASLESGPTSGKRSSSNATHAATSTQGMVSPQIVAAISAAVHTTLKGRARIISVGQVCPSRQAWSAEGRRQVFSSHKVR